VNIKSDADNARRDLRELAINYANAVDSREWDRLDALFLPDAWFDATAVGGIAGHYPEIKKWLVKSLLPFRSTMHFVGNFEYQLDGDTATGQVACINPMVLPSMIPGYRRTIVIGLWYEDEYQLTDVGWRIRSRRERKSFTMNEPLWMKIGIPLYSRYQLRKHKRLKETEVIKSPTP
jgi:hypothetical protein